MNKLVLGIIIGTILGPLIVIGAFHYLTAIVHVVHIGNDVLAIAMVSPIFVVLLISAVFRSVRRGQL